MQTDGIIAAAPLGSLFEKLTCFEVVPHPSKYTGLQFFQVVPTDEAYCMGGGLLKQPPEFRQYDLMYSRSGMATWLCCNAVPLFTELGRVLASRRSETSLDLLRLTPLIVDFLATEVDGSSTQHQAAELSRLMLSLGFGLLPAQTDWARRLKDLALGQTEQPQSSPVTGVIRWDRS